VLRALPATLLCTFFIEMGRSLLGEDLTQN